MKEEDEVDDCGSVESGHVIFMEEGSLRMVKTSSLETTTMMAMTFSNKFSRACCVVGV